MLQISAELLAMSSDAAVLIKNHRLVFANTAALNVLGNDCVDKSLSLLLGPEIASIQAGSYIGEFLIQGKRYIVRAKAADGVQALFLSDLEDKDSLISDAFIFSLRNCLMSIDVALSLIRNQSQHQPEQNESLKIISRESFRLNRILSNVSNVRAIRLNTIPFAPRELELSRFIRQILDSVSILVEGPQIKFDAPNELKIQADPALIENLVLNLLSNCFIHAKDCSRIKVSLVQGKDACFICIDDDGCGIEAEKLHSIFNRYLHHYEINDMSRGPGLGMTAVRSIASLHGGTLMLESRPGLGTSVRVSLAHKPSYRAPLEQLEKEYQLNMKSLLIGLADCLPAEAFCEKYFD